MPSSALPRNVATSTISLAEHDVREAEAAADQAAVAEQALDLLGRRVGGDVEILRMAAEQQIAHGAADQECRHSRIRAGGTARAARRRRCSCAKCCVRCAE